MEVDSHEHDWRIAEFAPNTTLGRQQATVFQLITAGHYNLSSFDVHRLLISFLFSKIYIYIFLHCPCLERARHIKHVIDEIVMEWQPIRLARVIVNSEYQSGLLQARQSAT